MKSHKQIKSSELFDRIPPLMAQLFDKYPYPWQILPELKSYLEALVEEGIEGYRELDKGILVGENVKIAENAVIMPPAIIGSGTEIRTGAFIRGSVFVGEGCVIGNSTELKNCVIFNSVQAPHYNYIGDSVLGEHAHLGAGVIASNFKAGGTSVTVRPAGDEGIETGLRKLGAILADGADVGCSCVLNPGTVIGKNTTVYPLLALRGVFPPNSIVKSQDNIVNKT